MEAEKRSSSCIPSPWVRLSVLGAYLSHPFSFYEGFLISQLNWLILIVTCVFTGYFYHILSGGFTCFVYIFFVSSLLYSESPAINVQQITQDLFTIKLHKRKIISERIKGENNWKLYCFLFKESQESKKINNKMEGSQMIRPFWNNSFCKHQSLVWKS